MSNKLTETSYPSKLSSKGFNHLSAETCKHMRNKFQCSMHTKWRKKPIFLYLHFIWQKVGHWQHCLLKACICNLRGANLSLWSIHPSMGIQMKQTARIHHRKATSFFFLSGPGIVSLASSLILVNKPTGLNRKKKHPQGHNDFSTWLYTLFQLGKEFLHMNNFIPCLKSTEPWCTNITRMWDTSMWSVNTGVQLHRKSVNFIIKVGKMRMDIFSIWSIFCESW